MDEEKRFRPIIEAQHRKTDFACYTVKRHSVMAIVNSLVIAMLITLLAAGCGGGRASKGDVMVFKTAEDARAHVLATKITEERFELPIANEFTFGGRPDTMGAGMAIVVDAILAQGYRPDGFEQREGYRLYRYKLLK